MIKRSDHPITLSNQARKTKAKYLQIFYIGVTLSIAKQRGVVGVPSNGDIPG